MAERRRKPRRQAPEERSDDRRSDERRASERRKDQRVATEIMVEVQTSGKRTYRRTANISLGGIGFHEPIPFGKGSRVDLKLRLIGKKKSIRATGEVIGADANNKGNRVRFLSLSPKASSVLQDHLALFNVTTRVGAAQKPPLPEGAGQKRVREGILIVKEDPEGKEFRLRSTDKIIGRDPKKADFVIDCPSVSRRHAHIYLHNHRHVITDLGSTNGIHFKNKPIHSLVLKNGMVFRVGRVKFQYLVTRRV